MAVDVPFVFDENFSELDTYDSNQLEETSAMSRDLAGVPPVSSPDEDYTIEVTAFTGNSANKSSSDNNTMESQKNLSGLVAFSRSSMANETNISQEIFETGLVPDFSVVLPISVVSSSPIYWFERGNENYNVSNYQKAIECFDKAIELNRQFKEAWCNKGIALCKLGNYQRAINAFDQAIYIGPDYSNARKNKNLAIKAIERDEEGKGIS